MTEENNIQDQWLHLLQDYGYRNTPARRTIVDVIIKSPRALEPMEVFNTGRKIHPKLGLVTVYRTIEKLEELGLVQRVHQSESCNMYLRATKGHQHLIICTKCGKAEYFVGDDISSLIVSVTRETGYLVEDHWLQLFGLCPVCKKLKTQ